MVGICLFACMRIELTSVYHLATGKQSSASQKSVLDKDPSRGKKWSQYFVASPIKKWSRFVHPLDLGLAV